MKKIQTALNALPEEDGHTSQRMNSTADSSFLIKVPMEPEVPAVRSESSEIQSDVSF